MEKTHKINTNNQLRLASPRTFHLHRIISRIRLRHHTTLLRGIRLLLSTILRRPTRELLRRGPHLLLLMLLGITARRGIDRRRTTEDL